MAAIPPLLQVSITPRTRAYLPVLERAVASLAQADASLSSRLGAENDAVILAASSEAVLAATTADLRAIDAIVGEPRVILREALRRRIEIEQFHNSLDTGPALVQFMFTPSMPGSGAVFQSRIESDVLPSDFVPAVERGVLEAAGLSMDVVATLTNGGYHIDSSLVGFETAARKGIASLRRKGAFVRLEPIMSVSVWTSTARTAVVADDLRQRGICNPSTRPESADVRISIDAPLVRLLGYQRDLDGLTGGDGRFDLAFKIFRQVELDPGPGFDPDLFPPAAAMRA